MKSSVGVTICAVVVLIGSALALVGAGGAAFMMLGPLRGQLFDPANLPPGADVGMMRAAMLSGVVMAAAFAGFGIATGIGLIRLWKWARYAAITMGIFIIVFSVLPGAFFAFGPIPPPSSSPTGEVPVAFRMILVGFYLIWAALAGVFVYVMMRTSTVAQFNGDAVVTGLRKRPLSVTIIAWLMIVSGLMTLPMLAWANLPAVFLGMVMTGVEAKVFYVTYMVAYVVIGIGLMRRTAATILPAVAIHSLGFVNALTMVIPSVWLKYNAAMGLISPMFAGQSAAAPGKYAGVVLGAAYAVVIAYCLLRARRTLARFS